MSINMEQMQTVTLVSVLLSVYAKEKQKALLEKENENQVQKKCTVELVMASFGLTLRKNPSDSIRINFKTFEEIFRILQPFLGWGYNTPYLKYISPREKLVLVLNYLFFGPQIEEFASVAGISKEHMEQMIEQVCRAIIPLFKSTIMHMESDKFMRVANEFYSRWQLPNCIGAIDARHVAIKQQSSNRFSDQKAFQSLLFLAISDASYKFTYIDMDTYNSEGNVFAESQFFNDIAYDDLDYPEDADLHNFSLPYFFIADDAFPMGKRVIKPYEDRGSLSNEEKIFNNRLSRARCCIENALGILCTRWLCLKRTMSCSPTKAKYIIAACCLLHNFLLINDRSTYCPQTYADHVNMKGVLIPGEWRMRIKTIDDTLFGNFISSPTETQSGIEDGGLRDQIKTFVNSSVGTVAWQTEMGVFN